MFCEAYQIANKANCNDALKQFILEYGAPEVMITDGSTELIEENAEFQATLRKN